MPRRLNTTHKWLGIGVVLLSRSPKASNIEALAAGTTGFGVRIRELESARNQRGRIVQFRAFQIKRGLRIHQNRRSTRADQNVTLAALGGKSKFVTEAITPASRNRDPQVIARLFPLDQRRALLACRLAHAHHPDSSSALRIEIIQDRHQDTTAGGELSVRIMVIF